LLGKPVTTATDIYALGLLLFELLTDTQAWTRAGGPIAQAVRVVLDEPVPVPSRRAASAGGVPFASRVLRGDFDSIVAKAVRREPQHRYATVEALEADINHALKGEPVAARSGARLYVLGRTLRRHLWVTLAIAAVLVSLTVGLGAAAWQARQAQIERDAARRDAAREEAVRYQLTRLVRAAIEERGSQPATAKSMIDNSALRVLREYQSQPQLAGQIVLTLADLYGALADPEGGAALLESFVSQAGPKSDPVAVADARQKLANIVLLQGHNDRAAQLLSQAEDFWSKHPNLYTEERLEGLGIKARLLRSTGDLDGASATEDAAITQRIAFSGRLHRETAVLYNSHGITLTAQNRLEDALTAYRQTLAIYEELGLGDELDVQVIRGNMGTLEYRTGHLREAEGLLKEAAARERKLAGDSAAVAAVMGLYAEVLTLTDRGPQGLPIVHEAVDLAMHHAGATSPLALQNQMFLADAQSASGDLPGARNTASAAYAASLSEYGPANLFTLRAQATIANLELKGGNAARAQEQLTATAARLRTLGRRADSTLAQVLQSLGEIALLREQPDAAITAFEEAIAILARFADSGWNVALARERLGEALIAARRPGAAELLQQAVGVLSAQLGESHPETIRARRVLRDL
jgi:tetratricopeptide (TPR) repeat protein